MQIVTDEESISGVRSDPDAAIALRARNDPEAFDLLYRRYTSKVVGYFHVRTGNRDDAEDLASQVFVSALEALPRFKTGQGTFRSWLFAIAHNLAVSHYRTRRRIQPIDTLDIQDRRMTPEDQAERADEMYRLRTALAKLNPDQRTAIELRLAGLSGSEISVAIGKSHAAVKMLQLRGKEQLQLLLQPSVPGSRPVNE